MDTLLAIVSPALFPTLERVLEVAFLTGFAHSWKLQATLMGQPNRALPNLTRRQRPVRKTKVGACPSHHDQCEQLDCALLVILHCKGGSQSFLCMTILQS